MSRFGRALGQYELARRREYYNDSVNINNSRMEQVPDRLLAPMAGLLKRPLFQASPEERADVDVAARLRNVVV